MSEEQIKLLISQVKRKLNITWDEEETNNRINDIIQNAIISVSDLIGIANKDFNYSEHSKENELFLSYCFYEWNNSLNDFENNYLSDIMKLRHKYEIKELLVDE